MVCRNEHPPIEHEEFHCPLCAAIEDGRALETALRDVLDAEGQRVDEFGVIQLDPRLTKQVNLALAGAP